MYDSPEQAKLASLIISIVILIIIIVLIVVVCCNWNTINANANANANNQQQPLVQNPQALAAAAMYNKNQGMNLNMVENAIKNNPQKAALGAYAYKNNFNVEGGHVFGPEGYMLGGRANDLQNAYAYNKDNFRGGGGRMGGGGMGGGGMGGRIGGHMGSRMGGGGMGGRMGGRMGGGGMGGQIYNNIQNARNGVSGSDWANWIQDGQAKGIAQNKVQAYQNSGCNAGSHMTQIIIPGVCGIQEVTTNGSVTTHCSGTRAYPACVPNGNTQPVYNQNTNTQAVYNQNTSYTASGCFIGSHMSQMLIPGSCKSVITTGGNISKQCTGTQIVPICVSNGNTNKNSFAAGRKKNGFAQGLECAAGYKKAYIETRLNCFSGICSVEEYAKSVCLPPQSQQCPGDDITDVYFSNMSCIKTEGGVNACHGGQAFTNCLITK